MKILKNSIFTFILGLILASGIIYAATKIQAKDIEYAPNVSVKDKIDDLYTKVKPEYTGSTTVTPSTSKQTLETSGKLLNDNITINSIPNTYKNLTTATTATASDIANGKTAYDSSGNLITGSNYGLSGSSLTTKISFKVGASQQTFNLGFTPNYINCIASNINDKNISMVYNSTWLIGKVIRVNQDDTQTNSIVNMSTFFTLSGTNFTWVITSSNTIWANKSISCVISN